MTDTPVILVCTNRDTKAVLGVGLYESLDRARYEAHRAGAAHKLFTVWTPRLNDFVAGASITGLSLPPEIGTRSPTWGG